MWFDPHIPLDAVGWLAWATLVLAAVMVLGLLMLRGWRWRQAPRRAAFVARWQPLLMACAAGEPLVQPLPVLAARERWAFMKLWLHSQMSLHGPCRDRLAALGRAVGCRELALARLDSTHHAERMLAILALGFLREAAALPLLRQRLSRQAQGRQGADHSGSGHTAVHAARALLEIDTQQADAVLQALLARQDLDHALVSILLKPFRGVLQAALLRQPPGAAEALRWLRLARALKLQVPSPVLTPFLQQTQDIELLIAAIRLVQGEQGAHSVAAHAQHADWRVRAQVAQALGFMGGVDVLDALVKLCTDAQWWVRYRAAQALLRIPGLAREQVVARIAATHDRYAINMLDAVLQEGWGGA